MGTGQLMLTLGAMMLLSFLVLRVNSNQLGTQDQLQNSKIGLMAISLGTSMMEEANRKSFDEKTVTNFVSNPSSLTNPLALKSETGEVYPNFDDFDDYNNQTLPIVLDSIRFNVHFSVYYINPNSPSVISPSQTFNKRMDIEISSPYMLDTLRLSTIFSYWKLI